MKVVDATVASPSSSRILLPAPGSYQEMTFRRRSADTERLFLISRSAAQARQRSAERAAFVQAAARKDTRVGPDQTPVEMFEERHCDMLLRRRGCSARLPLYWRGGKSGSMETCWVRCELMLAMA